MKKAIMFFVIFCVAAFSEQEEKLRVAVYMAGTEPVAIKGVHKVLGSELAKGITNSDDFEAMDRTSAVLQQIAKEQSYQRSGAVSDEQIKKLGEQLGVQYVCVAEVSEIKGKEFLFQARVVDVETARVLRASSTHSKLESMREMVTAAQKVAREIVTGVMEEDFLKVVEHMNSDRAIAVLTEAIQKAPNEAAYYMARGRQYHGRQEHLKTIADYTEAIRLEPGNAEYRRERALVYLFFRKDYDNAISDYNEVIRLSPNYAHYYSLRGYAHRNKKNYDKAIADYNKAIRLEPSDANLYHSRGQVYREKEEYDKAITDYNEAIRLKSDDADFYFSRGHAYKGKKDNGKAIADFESALQIRSNHSMAKYLLNELKGEQK